MRALFLLFLSCLLVACATGDPYAPPETALPAMWSDPGHAETHDKKINAAWWKKFNDPLLNKLVTRMQENNLDLKLAAARVQEARALRQSASSDFFPHISAHAQSSRTGGEDDGTGPAPATDRYTGGLEAQWEIDLFNRIGSSVEAGDAAIEALTAQQDALALSLIAETVRG